MPELSEALRRENDLVLTIVQAMLGNAPVGLEGLSFGHAEEEVLLFVLVTADSAEIRSNLEDIVSELESLLWPAMPAITVEVTQRESEWQERGLRRVFHVRTDRAGSE